MFIFLPGQWCLVMLELRDYQEIATNATWDWLHAPKSKAGLVVAPVASGKSLLIAEIIKRISLKYPRTKILVLSHVQELLVQDSEHILAQMPDSDMCFYSASLGQKRLHSDIVVAGIQSIHDKISLFQRCPSIIICDESHLISHKSETMYRSFIDNIFAINPNARLIGYTGSPFRADTGRLDDGDDRLFEDIIYEIEMRFLIEKGYLCKPITPKVLTHIDASSVDIRNHDYVASQLDKLTDDDKIIKGCVDEIILYGHDRKKWLIFTAGKKSCERMRDEIRSRGISCDMVMGNSTDREEVFNNFKSGDTRCLVNIAVATTGTNIPEIDLIAFCRPTKSPVLYLQCSGRGLRLSPGKENCLFLDFAGVIEGLGPLDAIDIRKRVNSKDVDKLSPITKTCPACGEIAMGASKWCLKCGYEFLFESNLQTRADRERDIMSFGPPERKSVLHMSTRIHKNKTDPTKPDTLRVDYGCLDKSYSEWICFNHQGFARDKAVAWHKKMRPDIPTPVSVEEAIRINYPKPSEIEVRQEGKYWRVTSVILPETVMEELSMPAGMDDYEEVEF